MIAGLNAPRQTVISGPAEAVDAFVGRAKRHGYTSTRTRRLPRVPFADGGWGRRRGWPRPWPSSPSKRPSRSMVSTVTGARLTPDVDIPRLLLRQVTSPVRFLEAMSEAAKDIDLWIEAGPGRVLTGLVGGLDSVAGHRDRSGRRVRGGAAPRRGGGLSPSESR